MAKYTIYTHNLTMICRDDGACIPKDPANPDYIAYLVWSKTNGTPTPVDAPNLTEMKWAEIRQKRNELLRACDWTQIEDYPGTKKKDWKTYRQALRDLPQTYSNPDDVVFPTLPE